MARENIRLDLKSVNLWITNPGIAWYPLMGGKKFDCPQEEEIIWDKLVKKHEKTGELHPLCNSCYKPKMELTGHFNQENLNNITSMLNSWEFPFLGKMNSNILLFYFRDKNQAEEFTEFLKQETETWKITHGKIDWQKACAKYRDVCPQVWIGEKEYLGLIQK